MKYCPQCGSPLLRLELSGRVRPACPDAKCGFVHWNNPIPVVAAIVEHADEVCLVRNVGWPAHWYGLVTGFLESGEMPEEAVVREVEEELGLVGRLESYIGMYEFYRANQLLIAYHVSVDSHDVETCKHEIADHKWVPIATVQPWTAGTGRALRDWLAARGIEREMVDFDRVSN
ncbi:MAG: NUDIX domain-containing protein [Gammaproteobacteria bacterium]|nr:NUDIX domain-containing protein [Gammaproteobacteria bacterium]MCP5201793.1 NUDIX domain-containing protein [Gammaproteobacteria bacterium]